MEQASTVLLYAVPCDSTVSSYQTFPLSSFVETERRDLRVDYLSSIDWFRLDGLYVIKAAVIVTISDGDAEARIILTFVISRWYLGGTNALFISSITCKT